MSQFFINLVVQRMRFLTVNFILLLHCLVLTAGAQINHQFSVISENDGYVSINNDGYYTNGLKINYQWRQKEKSALKKIDGLQIGQLIYNAKFTGEQDVKKLDRPITGYLYVGFHQKIFNQKQDLFKWGFSVGAIGKPSFGEQVQDVVHKVMQIYKPQHWELQLHDAWGITASGLWSPQVGDVNKTKGIVFKPAFTANLGNFFDDACVGGALLFGKFNRNDATVFWGNHNGIDKNDREYFFYLYPNISFKAYDATVQGGMFNTTPEKIVGKLNPVLFQTKVGVMYAGNKIFLGFNAVYEGKQSRTQISDQWYGSIQAGFMW